MKVLIYEDNVDDVRVLKGYLKEFFETRGICYDVKVYQNSFLVYDDVGGADVVFLDVEGMNENGVRVGEFIRKLNRDVLICFITNYSKYLVDGYKASANRFFLKPINKQEFFVEFADLLKQYLEEYEGFMDVSVYPKKIYYKDIVYVQYTNRKVWLYLCDGRKLVSKDSLKNWKERLEGHGFIQTYKSYVVNGRYIRSFDDWNVYISSKLYLPLSRIYHKGVEEMYYERLRRSL